MNRSFPLKENPVRYGLAVFPSLDDSSYAQGRQLLLTQRLEPSVLYVVPKDGESFFLSDNKPRQDIDLYLCSVYTRGWREFASFAEKVGRDKIVAGGYHATAVPEAMRPFAKTVVTGYCGNIDEILSVNVDGVVAGNFSFTSMRRDLITQHTLRQVYPDMRPEYIVGSMVSSVGCPYDCSFCSTPGMSGRKMRVSGLDYVRQETMDLKSRGVNAVFIRDESFATNPQLTEVANEFRGQFEMVYSFGTGTVMGTRPDLISHLAQCGWHSLNFGLEDIGVRYRKNRMLQEATENCHSHGVGVVLSFIVNDGQGDREWALENYRALLDAFFDLKPWQVCANFLMPMPGTGIWNEYKSRISENDFEKYDSKTPVLCSPGLVDWHRRMIVAVQLAYYYSKRYTKAVRRFDCGDTLHMRIEELKGQFNFREGEWNEMLGVKEEVC